MICIDQKILFAWPNRGRGWKRGVCKYGEGERP